VPGCVQSPLGSPRKARAPPTHPPRKAHCCIPGSHRTRSVRLRTAPAGRKLSGAARPGISCQADGTGLTGRKHTCVKMCHEDGAAGPTWRCPVNCRSPDRVGSNPGPMNQAHKATCEPQLQTGQVRPGALGFALPRVHLCAVRSSRASRLVASTAAPDGLAPSELKVLSSPPPPTPPQPPTCSPRRS
jgi:hypothetical protein